MPRVAKFFYPSLVICELDLVDLSFLFVLSEKLQNANGVLVPGGFGDRGVKGKILAAKYARENRVPYLGICLGMQTAVLEFTRSVLGVQDANSTEFDPDTKSPYVVFMPEVCEIDTLPLRNKPFFFFSK